MLLTLATLVLLATAWVLVFCYLRLEPPASSGPGEPVERAPGGSEGRLRTQGVLPAAEALQVTTRSTVPVQLVFAEASGDVVWLDCTTLRPVVLPDQVLSSGHPVTLRCARPADGGLGDTVGDTLLRWAEEDRAAELEFLTMNGEPRVRIHVATDEEPTTLQLELERAVA